MNHSSDKGWFFLSDRTARTTASDMDSNFLKFSVDSQRNLLLNYYVNVYVLYLAEILCKAYGLLCTDSSLRKILYVCTECNFVFI